MNPFIKKLTQIAQKEHRTIIGLMSGTSLDGLDIALCEISGEGEHTSVKVKDFTTKQYTSSSFSRIKKVTSVEQVTLAELCYCHTWLGSYHAKLILEALQGWEIKPEEIDCIASHGQTIYHYPAHDQPETAQQINSTLQIGDGDQIAAKTGIITVSDFRQKHTAFGGEGAPMAALVDEILFGREDESIILLNIGGIANYTYIPSKESGEKPFTTDTGPGNTLIDNLSQIHFSKPFDQDGKIAASGDINEKLLEQFLSDGFFAKHVAKTTGPEYFNPEWINKRAERAGLNLAEIPVEDVMATVTELSAATITENIIRTIPAGQKPDIFVSGGGARNLYLMRQIQKKAPDLEVRNISELGIDPDAKEAVIFAVLANEMLAGNGFNFKMEEGQKQKVNFGKISFPG